MEFERQLDELGRLVIPAELRKACGFKTGDTLRIFYTDNGILIYPNNCVELQEKDAKATEKDLILSDTLLLSTIKKEAKSVGVSVNEYVDRFLEFFYRSPNSFPALN